MKWPFGSKGRHAKQGKNPSLGLWRTVLDPTLPKGTGAVSGKNRTTIIGIGEKKKK